MARNRTSRMPQKPVLPGAPGRIPGKTVVFEVTTTQTSDLRELRQLLAGCQTEGHRKIGSKSRLKIVVTRQLLDIADTLDNPKRFGHFVGRRPQRRLLATTAKPTAA